MEMKHLLTIAAVVAALSLQCCKPAGPTPYEADECGVISRFDSTKNVVYLVFTAHFSAEDSGWFENFDGIVPVLDILKEKGVKGSFFPTGVCFSQPQYEEAVRRIVDEGHYLSHHSDAHLQLCTGGENLVSADSLMRDTESVEAKLRALGLEKKDFEWMIPPFETYNEYYAQLYREAGYRLIRPSRGFVTSSDWTSKDARNYKSCETMINSLWSYEEEHTLNGCLILIHPMSYPVRDPEDRMFVHLGEIIDGLAGRGYTFGTMKDII